VSASVCLHRSEQAVRYISHYIVKCDFLPCSLCVFCVNNRLSLTWSFVVVRILATQISDLSFSNLCPDGHSVKRLNIAYFNCFFRMSNIAMCTFFCSLECVQFAAEVSNTVVQFDASFFFPLTAMCLCVCVCVCLI